jgi:hypothetical protein
MKSNENTTTATDSEGWNDFLPAAYVEIEGAASDPENNAYYIS